VAEPREQEVPEAPIALKMLLTFVQHRLLFETTAEEGPGREAVHKPDRLTSPALLVTVREPTERV
jgi:hypothetical protein